MDALAQSFTARADEIDERMRGFAQSIADTVNDTEQRLLDARKSMEELLASTTSTVAETLDLEHRPGLATQAPRPLIGARPSTPAAQAC